jgi:hypothetical protein
MLFDILICFNGPRERNHEQLQTFPIDTVPGSIVPFMLVLEILAGCIVPFMLVLEILAMLAPLDMHSDLMRDVRSNPHAICCDTHLH